MKARAIASLVGCVALVLLLTPALASAAGSVLYRFDFKTHGYVVAAIGERATVVIGVSRKERSKHRGAETAYFARGTATDGLRAVFPGIGQIAMHFEPTGHWHAVAHCASGHPRQERAGIFIGKLRFVGEHRYLTAVRRRASGSERKSGRACPSTGDRRAARSLRLDRPAQFGPPSIEPSPAKRSPRTLLFAGFRSGPLARTFEASKRAQGKLLLAAAEEDVANDLGTYRIAIASAPRSDLQAARTLGSATVKGVAPFAGTATLRRAKNGSRSWTGDLTASFLGDPDVAMTGTLFKSRLSRGF